MHAAFKRTATGFGTVDVSRPPPNRLYVLLAVALVATTAAVYLTARTPPPAPAIFPTRWTATADGSLSGEVVSGGAVVAAVLTATGSPPSGFQSNTSFVLHAYDLRTGQPTWSSPTLAVLDRSGGPDLRLMVPADGTAALVVVADGLTGYARLTPAGPGETILYVLRLNASTGQLLAESSNSLPLEATGAQLLSDAPKLIVSWALDPWPNPASLFVRAYDLTTVGVPPVPGVAPLAPSPPPPTTGRELWDFSVSFPPSLDGLEAGDLLVSAAPGHVIVQQGYANQTAWVLADATGHLLWQRDLPRSLSVLASTTDNTTFYTLGPAPGGVEADRWSLANGTEAAPLTISVPADQNSTLWRVGGLLVVGSYVVPGYYAFGLAGGLVWHLPLSLTYNGSVCRCGPGGPESRLMAPLPLAGPYALLGGVLYHFAASKFLETFRLVNVNTGTVAWSADYAIDLEGASLIAYPRIFYPVTAVGPLVVVDATDSAFVLADFSSFIRAA